MPKHLTRQYIYNIETNTGQYGSVTCSQRPQIKYGVEKQLKSVDIDDVTYKIGDDVIVCPKFSSLFDLPAGTVIERKIMKINQMYTGYVTITFNFSDRMVPVTYLTDSITK